MAFPFGDFKEEGLALKYLDGFYFLQFATAHQVRNFGKHLRKPFCQDNVAPCAVSPPPKTYQEQQRDERDERELDREQSEGPSINDVTQIVHTF